MVWPCIFCGTVFVCPQSTYPYRDNDMISWIMFVCCSQPRALHVTLTNSTIGFQLNLWSLPCQQLTIVLIVIFFFAATTCWQDPTRSKQLSIETLLPLSDVWVFYLVISLSSVLFYILYFMKFANRSIGHFTFNSKVLSFLLGRCRRCRLLRESYL